MFATLLSGAFALLVWRIARVLFYKQRPRKRQSKCTVSVFLGSGGHTSEALSLLSSLDFEKYERRVYLVCEGDTLSVQKARTFELSISPGSTPNYSVVVVPRARNVHQSLLTTPFTSVISLLSSLFHLSPFRAPFADILILNGPGTCVIFCVAIYIYRIFGLHTPFILYVETFARVRTSSLSAKLIQPLADRFITQWPHPANKDSAKYWLV